MRSLIQRFELPRAEDGANPWIAEGEDGLGPFEVRIRADGALRLLSEKRYTGAMAKAAANDVTLADIKADERFADFPLVTRTGPGSFREPSWRLRGASTWPTRSPGSRSRRGCSGRASATL